ncbi:phosphotransferase [Nonomuraea rhizosphaerae]|uniref:phosphotransferase n=1 Tax=Nonomuraea rhizosphaerae TaxID=2665663 RepID=UPI001C60153C|nr:phosphotransferase [Nonomuraea rhizosphaerae]
MEVGELLGTGRSADVYALGEGRVLRRYRKDIDARLETGVMAHVAGHGYPVPRVYPGEGSRADIVMDRVDGPTMGYALVQGTTTPEEAGRVLARLLRRLHEIPARAGADPEDRVLHLDLHPENVILAPGGPVVIDWCNTREGAPALDCAMSAIILAQIAVDAEDSAVRLAHATLAALVDGLGDALDTRGPLERAMERRAADRALSGKEVALLGAAVALIRALKG